MIILNQVFRRSSSVICATGLLAACGNNTGNGETSEQPSVEAPTEPASAVMYPYVMEDGAVACSDGRAMGRNVEYYYFDKINAELRASPEMTAFAASRGVTSVDSCESARRLDAIQREHMQLQMRDVPNVAHPVLPEESVDKIKDGFFPNATHVVKISQNGNMICSGALIGFRWLLTAAHCFGSNGNTALTVHTRDNALIFSGTALVVRNPGFGGLFGEWDDLALVAVAQTGWNFPSNSSNSWRPIFGRQLHANSVVNIWGYGCTSNACPEFGTASQHSQRTSNRNLTMTFESPGHIGKNTVDGEGRLCVFDSGGPALTVGALGDGQPMIAGIGHGFTSALNRCPAAGDPWYYTQAGGGGNNVTCNDGPNGSPSQAPPNSCWISNTVNFLMGFQLCVRKPGSGFTFLRCF